MNRRPSSSAPPPRVRTMISRVRAIVPAWLGMLVASPGAAQTITLDTLSLSRLPGVRVEIEPYLEAAYADGLQPDSLRAIMETKLRDAGIDVLTEDAWQVTIGNPLLLLRLDLLKPSDYFYLYSLRLELKQLVVLARDSTIPAFSATWTSESAVGTMQTSNLALLQGQVAQQVDHFISAQAAANRAPYRWVRPVMPRDTLPNPDANRLLKMSLPDFARTLDPTARRSLCCDLLMSGRLRGASRHVRRRHQGRGIQIQ